MQFSNTPVVRGRVAWAGVLLAILATAPAHGQAINDDDLKAEVVAAWEAREAAVKTIKITYSGTTTYGAAFFARERLLGTPFKQGEQITVPEPGDSVLVFGAGDRIRHDTYLGGGGLGEIPFARLGGSFDGDTDYMFFGEQGENVPRGRVRSRGEFDQKSHDVVAPLLAFRARSQAICNIGGLQRLSPGTEVVNGHDCVRAKAPIWGPPGSKPMHIELWLDVARDYLPVRIVRYYDGKAGDQHDIEYERQGDQWAPLHWTAISFGDKKALFQSWRRDVTACVINGPVDEAIFRYDFPPGTRVDDEVERRLYYVEDDGGKTTIDDLFGPAPTHAPWYRDLRLWLLLAVTATIGAVVAYWRYKRR